ncbi:hypothetical protein ABW21_db0208778 [Orbilia brochopaga]|nr:hypothetical protein ABW21_db0208778 [Drechslerella brochopaga]
MTTSAEISPASSILLVGDLPLTRSEYSENDETLHTSSIFQRPIDIYGPALILVDPLVANPPGRQPDIRYIKDLGVSLTETMKKLWTRIWGPPLNYASGYATVETKSKQAALRFREKLRAIDEAHSNLSFFYGEGGARIAFLQEDFADLDTTLDDDIVNSLIVEGSEEAKEEDIGGTIKISLIVQKNVGGTETKMIMVEDLETEGKDWHCLLITISTL